MTEAQIMKKQIDVLRARPNTYGTFQSLMLLGNTLNKENGKNYFVEINFKEDCVILKTEVEAQ